MSYFVFFCIFFILKIPTLIAQSLSIKKWSLFWMGFINATTLLFVTSHFPNCCPIDETSARTGALNPALLTASSKTFFSTFTGIDDLEVATNSPIFL